MKEQEYQDLAVRIEGDLCRKLKSASSRSAFMPFLKKKFLKYKRHSPDWVRFTDRSFSWINGQYAIGLAESGSADAIRVLSRYYDRLLLLKKFRLPVFEVPDQTIHAEAMLILYEKYGKKRFKPLIREAADLLKRIAAENDGLVIYWPPDRELLVDTLGMISDFCYRYKAVFGDSETAELADRQIRFTNERCMDSECGFPFHAFDLATGSLKGSSTWGRGVGWYLLGLTAWVAEEPSRSERLWQIFNRVFQTQDPDGFLYDDLARPTHIDTSPTCMAALCLARCLARELFSPEQRVELAGWLRSCIRALRSSVNEAGEVVNCSGQCESAGIYSGEYGNYFSQGYTLALFTMLERSDRLQQYLDATGEVNA